MIGSSSIRISRETLVSPVAWTVLAAVIALGSLAFDRRAASSSADPGSVAFYENNQATLIRSASDVSFIDRWDFHRTRLPEGWLTPERARLRPTGDGMAVSTSRTPQGYQLTSPERTVDPGSYEVVVDGSVRLGGMTLGVVDAAQDRWLGTASYSSNQAFGPGRSMAASFRIFEPTRIRIILSNWAPQPISSSWLLSSVGLRARIEEQVPVDYVPPAAPAMAFYRSHASHLDPPRGTGSPPKIWDFTDGPAVGWNVYNGATSSTFAGGTVVRTILGEGEHQLSGPPLELGSGSYALVIEGRIPRGGLELGALDMSNNQFVQTARFWGGQVAGGSNAQLSVWFALSKPIRVQPIVANWAPDPARSVWTIRSIRLESDPRSPATAVATEATAAAGAERTAYSGGADELVPLQPDQGALVTGWEFNLPWWHSVTTPAGWRPVGRARVSSQADGTLVVAPSDSPGLQLQSTGPAVVPGRYRVTVDGAVLAGGLRLTAVDGRTDRVLATHSYWSGQNWVPARGMQLDVQVTRPTDLLIGFESWQSRPRASSWVVRHVTLSRPGG